jgi:hypothetical protein
VLLLLLFTSFNFQTASCVAYSIFSTISLLNESVEPFGRPTMLAALDAVSDAIKPFTVVVFFFWSIAAL